MSEARHPCHACHLGTHLFVNLGRAILTACRRVNKPAVEPRRISPRFRSALNAGADVLVLDDGPLACRIAASFPRCRVVYISASADDLLRVSANAPPTLRNLALELTDAADLTWRRSFDVVIAAAAHDPSAMHLTHLLRRGGTVICASDIGVTPAGR